MQSLKWWFLRTHFSYFGVFIFGISSILVFLLKRCVLHVGRGMYTCLVGQRNRLWQRGNSPPNPLSLFHYDELEAEHGCPSGDSISHLHAFRKGHMTARASPVAQLVKNPPANAGDARDVGLIWVWKLSWRRKWQPTPVFLPGKSHGQSSLVGYSLWGCKESGITEHTHARMHSYDYILSRGMWVELVLAPLAIMVLKFFDSQLPSDRCLWPLRLNLGGLHPRRKWKVMWLLRLWHRRLGSFYLVGRLALNAPSLSKRSPTPVRTPS